MAAGATHCEIFVGEWVEQVGLPDAPPGRAVFEWALRGTFLIQRSDSPLPEFPDGLMIIAYDDEADRFTQHYFDSRGVVRIYRMTLSDGLWTLLRTEADFTPLQFAQRYQGQVLLRWQHHRRPVGDLRMTEASTGRSTSRSPTPASSRPELVEGTS